MKFIPVRSGGRAFTLVEMLVVLTIIMILAALMMGGYTYAMRSSKRRVTTGTFEAIKLTLERYFTEFGEYPAAANSGQMMEFLPGKSYDISGGSCLYQAFTGDGYDQIQGASNSASSSGGSGGSGGSGSGSASAQSDGKTDGIAEIKNKMFADAIPQTIWTKKGSYYVIVDGFGRPFQYIKANVSTSSASGGSGSSSGGSSGGSGGSGSGSNASNTINSTYDLWSYAEDDVNTTKKSIDTVENTSLSVKWIKNW